MPDPNPHRGPISKGKTEAQRAMDDSITQPRNRRERRLFAKKNKKKDK